MSPIELIATLNWQAICD